MKIGVGIIPAVALAAAFVTPAQSQERQGEFSHTAIIAGQYASAERELRDDMRVNGAQPEALLNLAAIMVQTGRASEANSLYQRVLAARDIEMLLANGNVASSHNIARTGLRRLVPAGEQQVTAR